MRESKFQKMLKDEIKMRFPGAIILKNDPTYHQGIPDLLILWKDKWAMLEVKKSLNAHHQPNQDYWVDILNDMSYASFIYPEIMEEVLDELEQAFRNKRRKSRIS